MQERPDPRLLRLITERDELRKKLTSAERRASIFKALLAKEKQRTTDAKPVRREQRAG